MMGLRPKLLTGIPDDDPFVTIRHRDDPERDRAAARKVLAEQESLIRELQEENERLRRAVPHSAESAQSAESAVVLKWKPFPVHALPRAAADFIRAQSAALNCDEAMLAVPMLPVLAAAVGNTRRVQIKRSWEEPSTLWAAIIQRSGTTKSPALSAVLSPVNAIELRNKEEFDAKRSQFEYETERYNALPKNERIRQDPPSKPLRKRIRISDATIESVAIIHGENQRGLLLARDEIAGWLGSFDRYARGDADLQAWIELYDGRYLLIDRKTTDPPIIDIRRPAVCVTGTIQPKVLADKLTATHFDSGFASRLLIAHPPERPRRWSDSDVTQDVYREYRSLVEGLYEVPFTGEPKLVSLSSAARDVFVDYVNENADILYRLPDGPLRSVLSKLEAVAARIALIFTMCDDIAAAEVSGSAMVRAIEVAVWFRHEIARIHQAQRFQEKTLSRDERLVMELPEEFTWKEVAQTWSVTRRPAFTRLGKLKDEGLIVEIAHGRYRKSTTALSTLSALSTPGASSDGLPEEPYIGTQHAVPHDSPATSSTP